MRLEYQYLTSPSAFFHRNVGGTESPKHQVVSGTWSGLFPCHADRIRSMMFTVGLQWKAFIMKFQRKSRQFYQNGDD
jgi:hypothetical protein